ncbi:MAG: Hpt domain-containing protein [Butyrivibrio sp.]|nr:Hpt domain-containing protein [Butyrivibrio sp.]
MDFTWLEERGISTGEGIGYTGGGEKYAAALQRYYKAYKTNREAVETLLAAGDIEGYGIKVHALKSNARMIGAGALADAFEALELAAREGNRAYVEAHTADALAQYQAVVEALRPIGEMETVRVSGEISAEEARAVAAELLEALDEFDDDRSAQLAAKLMGYPFRLTQKQKLREAADAIGDFLYDEAADLIREIVPAIE